MEETDFSYYLYNNVNYRMMTSVRGLTDMHKYAGRVLPKVTIRENSWTVCSCQNPNDAFIQMLVEI